MSLKYSQAFYSVCRLEVNPDVYRTISIVVDSRCWVCLSYDRAVCALIQDDSEKNEGFKKAVSRHENKAAFQKSRSKCKSKYEK